MTPSVRINAHLAIPERELEFSFSRSGGPGGQNVNKRDTRVELVFDVANSPSLGPRQRARLLEALAARLDPSGRLRLVASNERSQAANREEAVDRLRQVLVDGLHVPKPRRATRPSRSAVARRVDEKKARSRIKRDRAWKPEA